MLCSITVVVIVSPAVQLHFYGGPSDAVGLLGRRLLFANLLVCYLLRQSFLKHCLKRRRAAEQNAKIQALQSRIRSHFLFNSMNMIASLILVNPVLAEQVVEDLSELFRASLQEAGTFVRTAEELDLCQRYLRIESPRLGDRLKVVWQVEVAPEDAQMPLLIIQPLLENAIYHGVQPLADGGTITVRVNCIEHYLKARITYPLGGPETTAKSGDGGLGKPRRPHEGNHLVIANIRLRLAAVYGEKAKWITIQRHNEFETTLRCPAVPKMI